MKTRLIFALALALLIPAARLSSQAPPSGVDFQREVRPILSENCFQCHGPDESNRKANLRLDTPEGISRVGNVLYQRITAQDVARRMPPASTRKALTDQQKETIRRWLESGAEYKQHWAFIAPARSRVPAMNDRATNAVDLFIIEKLQAAGLTLSPEADRRTLIRRVSLDLTGLPPTPSDVEAFVNDPSPDAYDKVVDRLLASAAYGERMAAPWLAAARYADTNGYQADGEREMWRWRDWVIDAFNQNMPFDQFTIEQLAGDLLPNPTMSQRIATGFNRNHRANAEGGVLPEEYFVEYVIDRVNTTSTVWLGLTVGCARCHDHKFDPIRQKEFYQLFAYFNNLPENGKARREGNSPPMMKAPTSAQEVELRSLDQGLAAAERQFQALMPQIDSAQRNWERSLVDAKPITWSLERRLNSKFPLVNAAERTFDGTRFIDAGDAGRFTSLGKFTLSAWIEPAAPNGAIVTRTSDVPERAGYALQLKDGKIQLNMARRWLDDALRLETVEPIELNRRHHVATTYDGSRLFEGVQIYVDGKPQKLVPLLDQLSLDFAVRDPLRIGGGAGPQNRFRGSIDDVRLYDVALNPEEVLVVANADSINEIAGLPPSRRSKAQSDKIDWYFLEHQAAPLIRQVWEQLLNARKLKFDFEDRLPTVMVMQEMSEPRQAHILLRGSYERPGDVVERGTPAVLPPLPAGVPNNRLGLAKWLVDPSNPLTARVVVNRFWEMYFGTGLVKTVDNFGSQGEPPSHPELLDWLATEFMRTGWDMKAMQKLIVSSATYKQSSKVTTELLQKDPENRLIAHAPRYRLPAEMVRDQALAISGLLTPTIGGKSVKPYQPDGLWAEAAAGNYEQDHGADLYRRSLYTFWKRAVPPPSMLMFDAATRESTVVSSSRTDTPLQALDLMNDVTYVEAARVLAEKVMTEGGSTQSDRIALAFRLATARPPSALESVVLMNSFKSFADRYRKDTDAAAKLISQGEHPRNEKLDPSELAAYTAVASLILNMDEVVTRQ